MKTFGVFFAILFLSGTVFADGAAQDKKQQRADEAFAAAEDAAAKHPNDPRAQYNLGCALYERGSYEESLDHFRRALLTDVKKDESDALYNLANAKYRVAEQKEKTDISAAVVHMKEALDYYRKAAEKQPKDRAIKENHEFAATRLKNMLEEQKKQEEQQKREQKQDQQNKTCPNPKPSNGGAAQKQDQQTGGSGAEKKQEQEQGGEKKDAQTGEAKKEDAASQAQDKPAQEQSTDQQKQDAAAQQHAVTASGEQKDGTEKKEGQAAAQATAEAQEKEKAQDALDRFVAQEGDGMLDDRNNGEGRDAPVEKDW